jgi:hypothetical protein
LGKKSNMRHTISLPGSLHRIDPRTVISEYKYTTICLIPQSSLFQLLDISIQLLNLRLELFTLDLALATHEARF